MMYAIINSNTGVIRIITSSLVECTATRDFLDSVGDECVMVKVPQMMLDEFGRKLLEEVHHAE